MLAVVAVTVAAAMLVPANADYGGLTARWWKWVYAQKAVDRNGTNTNPVLDSTGAYANVGQAHGIGPDNKYFFLTGTFGANVTRTVTIPKGKALFFPIINASVDNAVKPPTHYGVAKLQALAKESIDTAIVAKLSASFDGQPVPFFRTTAPTFDYTLPDDNSIYDYFGLHGPQFEGRVKAGRRRRLSGLPRPTVAWSAHADVPRQEHPGLQHHRGVPPDDRLSRR